MKLASYILAEFKKRNISETDAKEYLNEYYLNIQGSSQLHPLIHVNTSRLNELRFTSTFTGNELFFEVNNSNGEKALTVVSYIEMAYAAIINAISELKDKCELVDTSLVINDIIWAKPFCISNEVNEIHTSLFTNDDGIVHYEIHSQSGNGDESIVHSQGRAEFIKSQNSFSLDLVNLQSQMDEGRLSADQCYERLQAAGMVFSGAFKGIQEVHKGGLQLLSKLSFPESLNTKQNNYVLHPSFVASAFQSAMLLAMEPVNLGRDRTKLIQISQPISLDGIEIINACTAIMYALVRFSNNSVSTNNVQQLDIDLCDEDGRICVKISGLTLRKNSRNPEFIEANKSLEQPTLNLYQEYWSSIQLGSSSYLAGNVVYIGVQDELQQMLAGHFIEQGKNWKVFPKISDWATDCPRKTSKNGVNLLIYRPEDKQERNAVQGIFTVLNSKNLNVRQLMLVGHHDSAFDQSWIGYERSIDLARANLQVTILYDAPNSETILSCLEKAGVYRYKYGGIQQLSYEALSNDARTDQVDAPRENGTYVITGGMGSLGRLFAKYLARKYHAKLILLGRSEKNISHQYFIDSLLSLGAKSARYVSIDITKDTDLKTLSVEIEEQEGTINGVLHAAGVEGGQLITDASWLEFDEVLSANIEGTLSVNAAFSNSDWICYFSSSSAMLGDFGSCSYAVGKRYQLALSVLNASVSSPKNTPRLISINWPLWKEGGMGVANEDFTKLYLKSSGQSWLSEEPGIDAFETILAGGHSHALVMMGAKSRIDAFLESNYYPDCLVGDTGSIDSNEWLVSSDFSAGSLWRKELKDLELFGCVKTDITEAVISILKLPDSQLEDDTNFSDFGFDSISLADFSRYLNTIYQLELTPAVFFSHTNILALSKYILRIHSNKLKLLYQLPETGTKLNYQPKASENKPVTAPVSIKSKRRGLGILKAQNKEDIAIIGLSGRFPGAETVSEFWELLARDESSVKTASESRWGPVSAYYDETGENPSKSRSNKVGLLSGIDIFDPLFFEISPLEAEYMPPEERLFLMEAYHSIEDAGLNPRGLSKEKVGVFVGMEESSYRTNQSSGGNGEGQSTAGLGITSSGAAMISSRLSYFLNFRGPTVATNTACSSSLVAFHQACVSLRTNESDLALAAGAALLVNPQSYVMMSQAGMLSSEGKCQTFSNQASGIVCGESVIVTVLKRLVDAEADGDQIYGVVKASGINFDGKTNGVTAPNGEAQADLIRDIYKRYHVDVERIGYLVAHGTGTPIGDPIEVNALREVFTEKTQKQNFCALTSNKPNVGHTLAASGLVSVVNLLCAMKQQTIPSSLHCQQENVFIDWQQSPFYVNKTRKTWVSDQGKMRLGAVSSFGRSGTNAHVVIEEYSVKVGQSQLPSTDESLPFSGLLVVSAKAKSQLGRYAECLSAYLDDHKNIDLASFLHTFQKAREEMTHRVAFVVTDRNQLSSDLKRFTQQQECTRAYQGTVQKPKNLKVGKTQQESDAVKQLSIDQNLSKLAGLWVSGGVIDWDFFAQCQPLAASVKRLSGLPNYPFVKQKYWISGQLKNPESSVPVLSQQFDQSVRQKNTQETNTTVTQERTALFLNKEWQRSPILSKKLKLSTVVVVYSSTSEALAKEIEAQAKHVVLIQSAQTLNEEYIAQLAPYCAWVDLRGLDQSSLTNTDWLKPLQQVIEVNRTKGLFLLYVTQCLERFQNETVDITGAERVGLFRMLQSEYTALTSRHLDLEAGDSSVQIHAELILRELGSQTHEIEVCYRKGERYNSLLREIDFESSDVEKLYIPDSKVVLVTGGTRGLGLLCARHLVKEYGVKRLVLSGKEGMPPKNKWHQPQQFSLSIQEKIKNISALETLGAEVVVMDFPLDKPDVLKQAYQVIRSTMGEVAGVIHAAGIGDTDTPAFIRKTAESIATILAPKTSGVKNLFAPLALDELQFVVLFSSVSAAIPTMAAGLSDYAMANAYLDYYAAANIHNAPVISVQWPSWKESGMGETAGSAYFNSGMLGMLDAEGLLFLDQILAHITKHALTSKVKQKDSSQVISTVMPVIMDPSIFDSSVLLNKVLHAPENHIRSTQSLPVMAPESVVSLVTHEHLASTTLEWLRTVFATELKIETEQFDTDTPFSSYGVDSILMTQILRQINKALESDLDPSILLEHTDIQTLSSELCVSHVSALTKLFSLGAIDSNTMDKATRNSFDVLTVNDLSPPKELNESDTNSFQKQQTTIEQVAVVGMSCRLPGADSIDSYWELLSEGKCAIAPVPVDCWGVETNYFAGLVDNIYGLDPELFMLHPEDVQAMDPQAIVLLEESFKAIYHAGYTHQEVGGSNTGIYVGARSPNRIGSVDLEKTRNPIMTVGQNYLAANLSQFFDFSGPSLVIDTACSSALVSMNSAVEAIKSGSIDAALVGGVSLLTSPAAHEMFAARNLLQEKGEFHIFDQRASGIVLGEGCGMVYLKPLSKAKQDGDCIYAVLAGMSINNDGRTAGPATPNIQAQKRVMQSALKQSRCTSADLNYIDVNGSGSEVTDLLEIKAINSVYSPKKEAPLFLGSMKPNIGHPLLTEGIASFIKVALMLHHQSLVPFLSGKEPLQHFSISDTGFAFPRHVQSIPMNYAALNCFADGGTNAHVILQEGHSSTSVNCRTPLPLPKMNRVDVRTLQPINDSEDIEESTVDSLNHNFATSGVWQQTLSVDHPILANHKVYDQSLLPGLAWIDLLYQWFSEAGYTYEKLALKNLSIYRPLTVSESEPVTLSIQANSAAPGHWSITVSEFVSESESNGLSESVNDSPYITVEMAISESVIFDEKINIDEVISKIKDEKSIGQFYQQCQIHELVHTGMMKAEGEVYTSEAATWIHLSLNNDEKNNPAAYFFHPTLIDSSGVGAAPLILSKPISEGDVDDQRLFLPLFYESFKASTHFGGECYTRILHNSLSNSEELVSLTMEFFSPEGNKMGELKNLKLKLVRNAGLINPNRKAEVTQVVDNSKQSPNKESRLKEPRQKELNDIVFDSMDKALQSIVATKLGVDDNDISMDRGYYELGLDSAMLLELVTEIESILSTKLSPTLLFEYTTIGSLSEYLSKTFTLSDSSVASKSRTSPEITKRTKAKTLNTLSAAQTTHSPLRAEDSNTNSKPKVLDIAVIGMSGRYPQAATLNDFWQNLKSGKDCVTEIPKERWASDSLENLSSPSGKPMSKWGGFIDDVDCFDPLFFRISPREAVSMDPQERLFLEVCWESMEDAGYTPTNLVSSEGVNDRRPVGVFVGVMHKDYAHLQNEATPGGQGEPLSLNYAPIANRVSYFCNFHGPSMAIDTVCSSSLTAVHLAMESLITGECKLAFAGGVNLSLHPNKYQSYGMMDMHSSDGRCRSFGAGGDGYVSAEGIGALLLKPLHQARLDGDSIYAVLKTSSINHVGTASGLTVPSPVAQGDMIVASLDKLGINPESISYIEAHGTGTSLGDPIEIQGLNRAFQQFTDKKQFCALGSVKSNVGHAESAAGISGLTKTILQLHHKTLVKSLHSETINPILDLADSPFYVQAETQHWALPSETKNSVRRAGVSSFGATGSNAHVILEEYPHHEISTSSQVSDGTLIPISAKSLERLQEYATRLRVYVRHNPKTDLLNFAYTLQVGRIELQERLILRVRSIDEVAEKLTQWLDGQKTVRDLWQGKVGKSNSMGNVFAGDEDLQGAVTQWIIKGKHKKLAELWLQGCIVDWAKLYKHGLPQRIHLPTYPFAKERFWVSQPFSKDVFKKGLVSSFIHPLLHENTSDLSEQRFSSIFSGQEFFLNDHRVKGEKVLPGVGYLEMARVAVEKGLGFTNRERFSEEHTLCLKNIVWSQPLVVNDLETEVHIALFNGAPDQRHNFEADAIHFEIYSQPEAEGEFITHSQGLAEFTVRQELAALNIAELKTQMHLGTVGAEQCYKMFNSMGLSYGPGHQGIEEIYRGDDQLLTKLALPQSILDSQSDYKLHPCLLDSALQSCIGLVLDPAKLTGSDQASIQLSIPFSLDLVEVIRACSRNMFAWVRYSNGYTSATKVQKLDIDLCDSQGNICVKISGFTSRVLVGELSITPPKDAISLVQVKPVWQQVSLGSIDKKAIFAEHIVVLCETDLSEVANTKSQVEFLLKESQCLVLPSDQNTVDARYSEHALQCFELLKRVLESKPQNKVLIQIVVPNCGESLLFSGLTGLLKTAMLENPKLLGQLIQVDPSETLENLISKLEESKQQSQQCVIKYEETTRFVSAWEEIEASSAPVAVFKDKGVYLITGGLGGLGLVFANEILAKTKGANIILTGRSELLEEKQIVLDDLNALGGHVAYHAVDVADAQQVNSLVADMQAKHGCINGIIHSAGVIADNFILKKTSVEFSQVLLPKVSGSFNLDVATQDLSLNFFVLFSSISGAIGNFGQADYAAANGFMDQFANYRNQLIETGQRQGQTVSINWPLWKDGGMHVDEASEAMLTAATGMVAMQTDTGLNAFYQSLSLHCSQRLVMEGITSQLRDMLLPQSEQEGIPAKPVVETNHAVSADIDTSSLLAKIETMLIRMVSERLNINVQDIDLETELNDYGFDSVSLTGFSNQLNQQYQLDLTPTIFFEYSRLDEFASHLAQDYTSVFAGHLNVERLQASPVIQYPKTSEISPSVSPVVNKISGSLASRKMRSFMTGRTVAKAPEREAIAIVGMSGCFPGAENLEQFWENLERGANCITEIPSDRWNWSALYGDPQVEDNKTNIKWGGFIDSMSHFDPLFFGISPREAELMDPQQRLLMTHTYLAIEDAGYSASSLSGSDTGIFVGTGNSGYSQLIANAGVAIEGYSATGMVPSVGPNRMSFYLNIHGPSEPIETACSSSLVAVHRAISAMNEGSCDAAIVGGVNTIVSSDAHISFNKAGMLSEDGQCKTFSSAANGYVRGEGVGMLFLKKLSQAEKDGDHIYGVIKGSAENHGGRANSLTAPNPKAQAEVLKKAYQRSGFAANTISYIEAHGTGTPLGDPIEINGLKAAFKELSAKDGEAQTETIHCGIGSVKTNIGHLELAAGVAGVIKVLLQFKHQKLVRSLHCDEINPYIELEKSPFYLVQETKDWTRLQDERGKMIPRRAGVSSFGFGGSNAHVVLEEYTPTVEESKFVPETNQAYVIPLSARTKAQLEQVATNLLTYIRSTISKLTPENNNFEINKKVLTDRVVKLVSHQLQIEAEELDTRQDLGDYGLEMIHKSSLLESLQEGYEEKLDSATFMSLMTIESIVNWLIEFEMPERQLMEQVKIPNIDLVNLAYTLQVGREAMGERLGFIVTSVAELEEKLVAFLSGSDVEDCYHGQVKQNRETLSLITSDDEFQEMIDKWVARKKYAKLLELWVKGISLDWTLFYQSNQPSRISLPTYPFLKQRYWVPEEQGSMVLPELDGSVSLLHPLLHENTSDFSEQRFTSTFTGSEFFLKDHQVNGQKVLPGVAYLEMACVAAKKSMAVTDADKRVLCLKNIVWSSPFIVMPSQEELHIALFGNNADALEFEVYNTRTGQDDEQVYARGRIELKPSQPIESLNIAQLKVQMQGPILTAEACYSRFRAMGLEYGPAHQSVQEIYCGDLQVLAKLSLPASVQNTQYDYVLHPSLMDAALQSSIGLALVPVEDGGTVLKPQVPFALESVDVIQGCTQTMYAWVQYAQGSQPSDRVQKLDIVLSDEQGRVCVTMSGFTSRQLDQGIASSGITPVVNAATRTSLQVVPVWQEKSIQQTEVHGSEPLQRADVKSFIVLCELKGFTQKSALSKKLQSLLPDSQLLILQSGNKTVDVRYTEHALACFELIQYALKNKQSGTVRVQLLVPTTGDAKLFAGLAGLLKTAMLESPKVQGQVILLEPETGLREVVDRLQENQENKGQVCIKYEKGQRFVSCFEELPEHKETTAPSSVVLKDGGVYLITGGLGGLGLVFAKDIIAQTHGAKIVLTGRSALSVNKQAQLDELNKQSAQCEYHAVDVSNRDDVDALLTAIQHKHTCLNGIIHSAGINSDNFILNKSAEEFSRVLSPKVAGTFNLDQSSQANPLDFFVLFSSIASAMGNLGQADYATANSFMDQFADYRNELVQTGERQGQCLSINWPLWKDGGMRIDAASGAMMTAATGMVSMSTTIGVNAFHQGLSLKHSQMMVLEGQLPVIRKFLGLPQTIYDAKPLEQVSVNSVAVDEQKSLIQQALLDKVHSLLIKMVASLLKLRTEDIDLDAELSEYGFDSLSLTSFVNELNNEYRLNLAPTVFFEYLTLGSFAAYLVREYKSKLVEQLQLDSFEKQLLTSNEGNHVRVSRSEFVLNSNVSKRKRRFSSNLEEASLRQAHFGEVKETIAIVGMSGCFPDAENLEQFWTNLIEERSSISEVPADRWNWSALYGDPQVEDNKTNIKWGGFIDSMTHFDPLFFGISPREAELMDPQQRLLMTHAYLAIEDAGYSASSLSGSNTGIFVGTGNSGYSQLIADAGVAIEGFSATGVVPSVGPNRMSFYLNIHGPSEPIETACSSSLVAVHRAISAMNEGSCDAAIVGGVNTIVSPDAHISFNKAGMLSEDGQCKTFSSAANGYVRGEGVGMLFLKKLSQAERDGDHIYGVIKGSAENHGGRANSLTAPNPNAQAELLKTAYTKAGLDPKTITYIEAHGTGTKLGDPIEINGLKKAFKDLYQQAGYDTADSVHCGVGSVKTNIGHLELAAGVAGVIKVLLQFKHRKLVKTLHCQDINPFIDLRESPFYIVQEAQDWVRLKDQDGREIPRRAGVSSFGFGGSNAHVILEEYGVSEELDINPATEMDSNGHVLIPLSANNQEQLMQRVSDLLAFIQPELQLEDDNSLPVIGSKLNLESVAYTLQVGRDTMDERLGLIVSSFQELAQKLEQMLSGKEGVEGCYQGQVQRNKETVSMFSVNEELHEVIERWMNKKKYSELLDLWVKGLELDWRKLYEGVKPKRISLPTYPFAKERYWVSETQPESSRLNVEKGDKVRKMLTPKNNITNTISEEMMRSNKTSAKSITPAVRNLVDSIFEDVKQESNEFVIKKYGV